MAREPIELECTECGRRNYSTTKNTHKKKRKTGTPKVLQTM
jgi:ribosomal protein L33